MGGRGGRGRVAGVLSVKGTRCQLLPGWSHPSDLSWTLVQGSRGKTCLISGWMRSRKTKRVGRMEDTGIHR